MFEHIVQVDHFIWMLKLSQIWYRWDSIDGLNENVLELSSSVSY